MATADAVIDGLIAAEFNPLDPVFSNRKAWSNYYDPLRDRLRLLVKRHNHPQALSDLMVELEREIAVYDIAGDEVALCFFLARRDSITEVGSRVL